MFSNWTTVGDVFGLSNMEIYAKRLLIKFIGFVGQVVQQLAQVLTLE